MTYSCIRRFNPEMAMLSKLIYKFNTTSFKILAGFFTEIDKLMLKFIWKFKKPNIAKIILKRIKKIGGLTFSDTKTYTKQN